MHLVGFIIRIYHHARSPERQIRHMTVRTFLTGRYEIVLEQRSTNMTITEVSVEQLKVKTTGVEPFEHRCSSVWIRKTN